MIATRARDRGQLLFRLLVACGLPSVTAVAFGGLALGALLWSVVFRSVGPGSILAFAFTSILGLLGAALLWIVPPAYVARETRADLTPTLRSDAVAWACLAVVLTTTSVARGSPATAAFFGALAFIGARLFAAARTSAAIRDAAFAFVLTRAAVYGIGYLAIAYFGPPSGRAQFHGGLAAWAGWDGLHYLAIAQHGYVGTDMVFFPLYPSLIRILAPAVGGNPVYAALVLSNIALFTALIYVHRIVQRDFGEAVARRSTLLIAAFPASLFYSAAYTEALFLALTVAALFYLGEHRWMVGGILGGFAALTRVEGVLLVAPYVAEALASDARILTRIRTSVDVRRHLGLGIAMIPFGLVTYMLLLLLLCGDPLYFTHAQAHWSRTLNGPWVGIARSLHAIWSSGNAATIGVQTIELSFSLAAIAVLVVGARMLPPAQRIYAALSLLLPLCTSSLMSMPRFAGVVFPLFTILAVWSARDRLLVVILAVFLPLLGFFVTLFTTGRWVA